MRPSWRKKAWSNTGGSLPIHQRFISHLRSGERSHLFCTSLFAPVEFTKFASGQQTMPDHASRFEDLSLSLDGGALLWLANSQRRVFSVKSATAVLRAAQTSTARLKCNDESGRVGTTDRATIWHRLRYPIWISIDQVGTEFLALVLPLLFLLANDYTLASKL